MSYSPDGKELAMYKYKTKEFMFWNFEKEQMRSYPLGFRRPPNCMAYSPNGKMIAFGGWSNDPYVKIFDPATGQEIQSHTFRGIIRALAFSPDSKLLAIADGG